MGSKTNEIKESLESQNYHKNIDLSQVYLFVIVYCVYNPTGKRKIYGMLM